MKKRPTVKTKCVAQHYAAPNERIVEYSSNAGGGLISFRVMENGTLRVELYRHDPTVSIGIGKNGEFPTPGA